VLQQQRRRLWQHACIWQERKKDIQTFYFRILRLKIYLIKMGLPFELSLLSARVCVCKFVCVRVHVCEGVCVCALVFWAAHSFPSLSHFYSVTFWSLPWITYNSSAKCFFENQTWFNLFSDSWLI
jgi:hypothetical protein